MLNYQRVNQQSYAKMVPISAMLYRADFESCYHRSPQFSGGKSLVISKETQRTHRSQQGEVA